AKEHREKAKEATLQIAALEKDKTKLQNELAKRDTDLKKAKAEAADQSKVMEAVAKIEKEKSDLSAKLAAREADLKKVRMDLGKLHLKAEANDQQMQALKVRFATVDPVRYALGAADVRDQQERVLRDVKEVLAMFPKARFEIVGHTCDLGSKEGNLKLSQDRASSLVTFLTENGIATELLTARGIADGEPLVPNTSEANRRRNRRTEIHILD
ncbi:OmpA family protein, partial [Akkermansiaceae bacterium]|nr:OmpA family protein [Akkermansiaceae bacterium]